jgi:DNA-binding LytR/AlgR family response regulator
MAVVLSDTDFIECFKSIFVNVEKIKSVNTDTITLVNDHKLPVSRRSRKGVMLAVMKKVRDQ